jgi:hypothetical protein
MLFIALIYRPPPTRAELFETSVFKILIAEDAEIKIAPERI